MWCVCVRVSFDMSARENFHSHCRRCRKTKKICRKEINFIAHNAP
jgi:hypothetical protein